MQNGWVKTERGWRKVYSAPRSPVSSRSTLACPYLISDSISPVRSMADNQMHDSRSSLYRSYRADGNPQGVEYRVVGDDQRPDVAKRGNIPSELERKKSRVESVQRAEAAISRGQGAPLPD